MKEVDAWRDLATQGGGKERKCVEEGLFKASAVNEADAAASLLLVLISLPSTRTPAGFRFRVRSNPHVKLYCVQ